MAILPLLELRAQVDRGSADDRADGHRMIDLTATIARRRHISQRTLWKWLAAFDTDGFDGLVRKRRRDSNRSRFFGAYPDAARFVDRTYRNRPATEILRGLSVYIDSRLPSIFTLRAYIRTLRSQTHADRLRARREAARRERKPR
jgi:hypothetical protein